MMSDEERRRADDAILLRAGQAPASWPVEDGSDYRMSLAALGRAIAQSVRDDVERNAAARDAGERKT